MRSTVKIAAILVLTREFIFGNLSMVSGTVKTVLLTAAKVEKLLQGRVYRRLITLLQ